MKVIGHRGARGLAPENTLAALLKGLEHHVDELEIDLRVSRDKVVLLSHNKTVTDPSGKSLAIHTHTFKELKDHKKDLIDLKSVFEALGPAVPFYLEVKRGEDIDAIVKLLKEQLSNGWTNQAFSLGSKSQSTLRALHQALPDISKIVIEPWSGVRAHYRARQVGTKKLSMNQLWLWSFFIRSVKRGGYELYAYPLNDPKKVKKWQRYGLSGVITDYPDRF